MKLILSILLLGTLMVQFDPDKYENKDIFAPWNSPLYQEDVRKPWNDPIQKDDIFAPWNRQVVTPQETKRYFYQNNNAQKELWDSLDPGRY